MSSTALLRYSRGDLEISHVGVDFSDPTLEHCAGFVDLDSHKGMLECIVKIAEHELAVPH